MNKEKKCKLRFKNICMMFVVALIVLGLGISAVLATEVDDDSTATNQGGGKCGSGNCVSLYTSGVRIYAVSNKTGEKWPNSTYFEIWFGSPKTAMNYSLYQKYTRQEVLNAVAAGNKLGWTWAEHSIDSFKLLTNDPGLSQFHNLGLGKKDIDGADKIIKRIKSEADAGRFEALQQIVEKLGLKHKDGTPIDFVEGRTKIQLEIEELRDLTLQFEPLAAVYNHGASSGNYKFIGTVSELAYFNAYYGYAKNDTERHKCNAISNWLFTNGYEGIFASNDHATLTGTTAQAGRGCLSDTDPGTLLTNRTGNGVGFINIDDILQDCDNMLDAIIKKYPGSQIRGESAKKELHDLFEIYPLYNGLTEWEEHGKTAPVCEPLTKNCDEELQDILNKYTQRYEDNYGNNANCRYYFKGYCYRSRTRVNLSYYSYYCRYYNVINLDCNSGYLYSGRYYVNSYVNSSNKNETILNWAMNDLQALYDRELAKGNNFNLLTDWKSYGLDAPKCEYREKPCIPTNHLSQIDDCYSGYSFFRDDNQEDIWLDCEMAFNGRGANYSSDNTGHVATDGAYEQQNGGIVGNYDYCEVFCTEEVSTQFPTHVKGVRASQTFTWGSNDGVFGNVNIKKKCSNQDYIKGKQGYRFEEWKEDYLANEKALVEHYMKKASHEKQLEQIPSISPSCSWIYTQCCDCCYEVSCATEENPDCSYTVCPNNCVKKWMGSASVGGKSHSWTHNAGSNTINVGHVPGSVSTQSYSTGYSFDSCSSAKESARASLKSQVEGLRAAQEAAYTGKIITEQELLKKIRQCTSNIKYVYETAIRFVFREPVNATYGANTRNFTYDDFLEVSGTFNQNNVNTSKCKDVTAYSYTCSGYAGGAICHPTVQMVRDCEVVTWDITGSYTHSYPVEDFQWYSLKTDSTLVNEKLKGPEDESFFYYIGFGLPTAFSLTNGTYELKAIVSKLGDSGSTQAKKDDPTDGIVQYNEEYGHFWPMANQLSNGDGYGFEYVCTYEVENEIFGYDCRYNASGQLIFNSPAFCDDDEDDDSDGSLVGIDVTYRLVTLLSKGDTINKAFPGISGGGRPVGSNWDLPTATIQTLLDADIYETDSKAMYEIMLDINAINRIREDNEGYFNSGKDPYTSYYDENNRQKVYCAANGNQKYCASDFVSELYRAVGLNYPLLGTCLPMANTLGRAEYVLAHGCDTHYQYPELNWMR